MKGTMNTLQIEMRHKYKLNQLHTTVYITIKETKWSFESRSITNKKYMRRQAKRMQEQTRHNRESSGAGGHGATHHPGSTAFIPRTAR